MKWPLRLLLGGAFTVASAMLVTSAHAQEVTAKLKVQPANHAGACPTTFTFKGEISATQGGPVHYQWIRSDGGKSPNQVVMIGDPGSQGPDVKMVETTWKLGAPGQPPFNGWIKLRVISPKQLDSNQASFNLNCAGAPVEVKAQANAVPADHKGVCPATITFNGQIHANKAGPVQYHWQRSDGAKSPMKVINFPGPGAKNVTTTWKLGGPGTKMNGWQQLHIDAPVKATSNQAAFSLDCGGPPAAQASAKVSVVPANYKGSCPAQVKFFGQISSNKAGPVQYRWLRSDGAQAPVQVVVFAAPGVKNVQTTWQLGGPGLPKYKGWQAIQIVAPGNAKSNEANFSIECAAAAPVVKAQAVAVPGVYKGSCPATITFKGQIHSNKAGPVQYRWERSDGAKGPVQVLNFGGPGSQNVQTTWQLGGMALPKYNGFQRIHVIAPVNVQSNAAQFTMSCKK